MTQLKPRNIYYMLSYAYRILTEKQYISVGGEEFENIHNLFAEILWLGISGQVKRGLCCDYQEQIRRTETVRGRICLKESLPLFVTHKRGVVCSFDEYTHDSQLNRVLKTTVELLIGSDKVTVERKNSLRRLMRYFSDVKSINPSTIQWKTFQYDRNNARYRLLINICYLVISGLLIKNDDGTLKISEYLDDSHMSALYERFILEYFRYHYPELSPAKEKVSWNVENEGSIMLDFMPELITDIVLRYNNHALIIDAKYYQEILVTSHNSNHGKIRSQHLQQIQTYVVNMDVTHSGNVEGMLLYAKTDSDKLDNMSLTIGGNLFHVVTLDLSAEWNILRENLDKIANEFKLRSGTI